MDLSPKIVHAISHPFISSAYIRKDFSISARRPVNVLVIDAVDASAFRTKKEHDTAYHDFLANLDLISRDVTRHAGAFHHIDIRMH